MTATEEYINARDERIKEYQKDKSMEVAVKGFTEHLVRTNYVKNWTWMGVPILQYPTDIMAMQELLWQIQPDYIIETGVAFAGSTLFYSHILQMIGKGKVIAIDIDMRPHTVPVQRRVKNVRFIQDDSSCSRCHAKVLKEIGTLKHGMVILDSCHTADHVLRELRLYAPLVSVGSYAIIMDTALEFFGHLDKNQDRPWHKGNSPYTAVQEFMKNNDEFVVDKNIENRILITSAIGGFLRRIK